MSGSDVKEEAPSGPSAPPAPGGFSSFNAASFFAQQSLQREQAAAELQAASRALLPSSSEDEDSSENEDKPRRKRQAGSPTEGAAGERTHTQPASKRRKKDKKERKRSHRDRAKKDAKQAAEQERIIARELAAGAHKRQGAQASAWAAASGAAPGPSFFQDTRGDPGNVAFGAMYRGDIAAYHRLDPTALSSALRGKGGRQGSADQGHTAASAARRRVPVQRWVRLGDAKHSGPRLASTIPSSDFLPLDPSRDEEQGHSGRAPGEGEAAGQVGGTLEAPEGYLLRRTRDFNAATREHPESLQTWLDFAAFQDEVLATIGRRRRGSRQAAAEKKISILEKALEHHPGSDELLNALLDAAAEVCDAEELELRWRRALAHFGGSAKLWKAYIHRRRGQFSGLSVPEVADAYRRAAVALRRERERRIRQGVEAAEVVAVERDIVEMLLEGAEFHLQTGHTERGCAQVQAMLEFNFFAPEGWPEDALELMFEEFWRSGVPAIGEEGAQGWGQWLSASAQEPPAPNAPKEASASAREEVPTAPDTKQPGDAEEGKSAWVELAPAIRARFGHALRVEDEAGGWTELAPGTENEQEGAKGAGEEDEGLEEESEQEETEEELLARMGMDLEAALAEAEETLTPDLLSSWLELERRRDAAQWQPVRQPPGDNLEAGEDQGVDLLLRACPWKDVVHCAVLFSDPGLKDHLLHGCLNLLGLPQTAVWSSHDAGSHPDDLATALQWVRLGEAISPDPVRQVTAADAAWQWLGGRVVSTREGPWWAGSQERHAFVLRCLEQLLEGPAKGDALVGVMAFHLASWEGLPSASTGSGAAVEGKTEPRWRSEGGRTMAKRLLGRQSGNLVLWGAFAEMELQAGAVKSAKNVCQACLSSIAAPLEPFTPGLAPLALTLCRSILNITYSMGSNRPPVLVEWLLGLGSKWETAAAAAALRPLLWLGSEGNVPLGSAAVAEEAAHEYLAARRGFQAALLRILRGGVKAFDGAARYLISAAATAELLMGAASGKGAGAGAPAALAVYGQVLAALLPEREESDGSSAAVRVPPTCPRALVDLAIERCAVAVDASMHAVRAVPPKTAHDLLHVSLLWFPGHPALLRLLCSLELGGHSVGALRRQLNMHLTAYPACSTWLALVAVEVRTGSPRSAVRAVLERACAHPSGRSCPLLWRIFLRHEAQRPQALHRVFLRAIEACPWDKSVWMDGLALLNGSAPPKELSDYLSAMRDKDLAVRTDTLEVVLGALEEEGSL